MFQRDSIYTPRIRTFAQTLIVHKIDSYFDVISLFLVLTVTLFCSDRSESDRCCVLLCVRLVLVVFLCFAFFSYYSIALCFSIWYLSLPLNSGSIIIITVCDHLAEQKQKNKQTKKTLVIILYMLYCFVLLTKCISLAKFIREKSSKKSPFFFFAKCKNSKTTY